MRPLLIFALLVFSWGSSAYAETSPEGDAALAKARARYPVTYCVVSNEHLKAGEIIEFVYQETGKPDRLIRFCCRKCLARFKANPTPYLEKLDRAAQTKEKTESGKSANPDGGN